METAVIMDQSTLILSCLKSLLDPTTFNQLTAICQAMLCMSGRITMLGISRWSEKGGSYRTIQRFFKKTIPWSQLNWAFIKPRLTKLGVILIAGDATTVTKAGKKTFGVGRFFSSIYSTTVPGLSFQALSLIDVSKRKSWPILIEQIMPKAKIEKPQKKAKKRGKGRPKGSKNKNKSKVVLNEDMKQVQGMLCNLLKIIGKTIKPIYFVYDGAFGNNAAVQMTLQSSLQLISKLRNDSALYLPWNGKQSKKGARKIYGGRLDYTSLPKKHLKSETTENGVRTTVYQSTVLHKKISQPLNAVIICKQNMQTKKTAHIILFSTDLELGYREIEDYYSLRFQIEFNFRDAKQHWGLEDFMVTVKEAVSNAANISFWMVNFTEALLPTSNAKSILDLKAMCHGVRYAKEVFKLLPENAQAINNDVILEQVSAIGRIHDVKLAL